MRITDLLSKESIKLNLSSKTKPEVIDEMVDLVNASGNLNNKDEYKEAILAREELSTTAVGEGIAIPHAKTKAVKKACLGAGVTKKGIDYEAFAKLLDSVFQDTAWDVSSDISVLHTMLAQEGLTGNDFSKKQL